MEHTTEHTTEYTTSNSAKPTRVIGITGGVGSGKSVVLQCLKEDYNAHIIIADEVAHRLMEVGGASYQALVELLGPSILAYEGGPIDHKAMAAVIFADQNLLKQVNELTHPLVISAITEEIAFYRTEHHPLVVVETALPVAGSLDVWCDEIWYIYVPRALRIERLMNSRGYSLDQCYRIMKKQFSEEQYRAISAHVIHNDQSVLETKLQITEILGAVTP